MRRWQRIGVWPLGLGHRGNGRWETPRASFIPAQDNALGSSAQNPISAESAIHTRNPWFQLLCLGLIPMKSQPSTNSVLRPCPRSETSKMRTVQAGREYRACIRSSGSVWMDSISENKRQKHETVFETNRFQSIGPANTVLLCCACRLDSFTLHPPRTGACSRVDRCWFFALLEYAGKLALRLSSSWWCSS